jgi:hypothetical protein
MAVVSVLLPDHSALRALEVEEVEALLAEVQAVPEVEDLNLKD